MAEKSSENTCFVEFACHLASNNPMGMFPCPVCGDSLKGDQLDRHLTQGHLLGLGTVSDLHSEAVTLTGADRSVRAAAIVFPCVFVCSMLAAGFAGASLDDLVPYLFGVLIFGTVTFFAIYYKRILPASLTLNDGFVVLCYGLRLFRCKIPLDARLQVGSFYALGKGMAVGGGDTYAYDWERGGPYIQFFEGWSSITVACARLTGRADFLDDYSAKVSGPGRYWNQKAWREGGKRRRWDITLDPASFAILQYALAARGILSPRSSGKR